MTSMQPGAWGASSVAADNPYANKLTMPLRETISEAASLAARVRSARPSGCVRKDQCTGEGVSAEIGIGRGGRGG